MPGVLRLRVRTVLFLFWPLEGIIKAQSGCSSGDYHTGERKSHLSPKCSVLFILHTGPGGKDSKRLIETPRPFSTTRWVYCTAFPGAVPQTGPYFYISFLGLGDFLRLHLNCLNSSAAWETSQKTKSIIQVLMLFKFVYVCLCLYHRKIESYLSQWLENIRIGVIVNTTRKLH